MDNIQDLKEAEWAFRIFSKCIPEQYRKKSIAVLVGKYSDRTPSDKTIEKIKDLYIQYLNDKDIDKSKIDFISYTKTNY